MNHTPGPWKVRDDSRIVPPLNATQLPICKMGSLRNKQEQEANARLIAAAPDMLATIKDLAGRLQLGIDVGLIGDEAAKAVDAAIALIVKIEETQ
jgi:hypothetical protein